MRSPDAIVLAAALFLVGAVPFSTDGEATAYLEGDFRRPFAVSVDMSMTPFRHNASWSTASIALLGGPPPADAVTVGIFPSEGTTHAFFSVTRRGRTTFQDVAPCAAPCRIALRADASAIIAFAGSRRIGTWNRSSLRFTSTSLQLNGEVAAPGDRLNAQLIVREAQIARRPLHLPTCGFSTKGVKVRRHGRRLDFAGLFDRSAPSRYVSLDDPERTGESCRAVTQARPA